MMTSKRLGLPGSNKASQHEAIAPRGRERDRIARDKTFEEQEAALSPAAASGFEAQSAALAPEGPAKGGGMRAKLAGGIARLRGLVSKGGGGGPAKAAPAPATEAAGHGHDDGAAPSEAPAEAPVASDAQAPVEREGLRRPRGSEAALEGRRRKGKGAKRAKKRRKAQTEKARAEEAAATPAEAPAAVASVAFSFTIKGTTVSGVGDPVAALEAMLASLGESGDDDIASLRIEIGGSSAYGGAPRAKLESLLTRRAEAQAAAAVADDEDDDTIDADAVRIDVAMGDVAGAERAALILHQQDAGAAAAELAKHLKTTSRAGVGLELRLAIARLYARAGRTADAHPFYAQVAKLTTDADARTEADAWLRTNGFGRREQGKRNVAGSPELRREQKALRERQAEVGTERGHLEVGEQQLNKAGQATGWALLGMEIAALDIDLGYAVGSIDYHDKAQRKDEVMQVVGGKLLRADGQEAQPTLTVDNVEDAMPRVARERFRELAIQKLTKHGKEAEAETLRHLDPTAQRAVMREVLLATGIASERWGKLFGKSKIQVVAEGRMIFVMNRSGQIFVGNSYAGVTHHSSFLAGGAVAAAGDVVIAGGQVKAMSNNSGHYKPGPAYLWQAVRQLELEGVDVATLQVEVLGAGTLSGAELVGHFSPLAKPGSPAFLSFDSGEAVRAVRRYLAGNDGARATEGS